MEFLEVGHENCGVEPELVRRKHCVENFPSDLKCIVCELYCITRTENSSQFNKLSARSLYPSIERALISIIARGVNFCTVFEQKIKAPEAQLVHHHGLTTKK